MTVFPAPVKQYHTTSYSAIDPANPALSQAGKNIVVTGGGQGIGKAIALSFAKAGAANLALIGRTQQTLELAKHEIESEYSNTKVHIFAADIVNDSLLKEAFTTFAQAVGSLHTLVANAGYQPGWGPIASYSKDDFARGLMANIVGTLNSLQAFIQHIPREADKSGYRAQVIHTSSASVQLNAPHNGPYSIAKMGAAKLLEAFAAENPDIWVCNFHPGILAGAMDKIANEYGVNFEPKDDMSLPADWTVWAASKASSFVPSGRFVWAHWDVDEMKAIFEKYKKGDSQDGLVILGGVPFGQNFTLGVLGSF